MKIKSYKKINSGCERLLKETIQTVLFGKKLKYQKDEPVRFKLQDGTILSVPISMISKEIYAALPTCYGRVYVNNPIPTKGKLVLPEPIVKIVRDKCNTLSKDYSYVDTKVPKNRRGFTGNKGIPFLEGGSSASTVLIIEGNRKKVRKYAYNLGIFGNGIRKLIAERFFISSLPETMPDISPLYPSVSGYEYSLSEDTEKTEVFFDMEYIEGQNVIANINNGCITNEKFFRLFSNLLDILINSGFLLHESISAPSGAIQSLYTRRAPARIAELKRVITSYNRNSDSLGLFHSGFYVNGEHCIAPEQIIHKIEADYFSMLSPVKYYRNVHGDMTVINMIHEKMRDRIRLVDPRGSNEHWDPLYDIGKALMSLRTGYYHSAIGKLKVIQENVNGHLSYCINLIDETKPARSDKIAENFLDFLDSHHYFKQLMKDSKEIHWRERIEFAAAIHLLADCEFKLYTQNLENAIGVYLLGTLFLNRFYKSLERRYG